MSELAKLLAEDVVTKIIDDAGSGDTYAPCFRDCLSDNRQTAERRIAEAIDAALNPPSAKDPH